MKERNTLTLHVTHTQFLQLIFICAVLSPWIPLAPGMPLLRPEWFILIAGLMVHPAPIRVLRSPVTLWAGLVVISYLFSLAYGMVFLGMPVILKDIYTLVSPVLFYLFFIFAASGTYTVTQFRQFLKVAKAVFFMAAVIAIVQFLDPDLVRPITVLWTSESTERLDLYVLQRATGSMGNANALGFLMVIGFALTLFTYKYRDYGKYPAIIILGTLFVAVFASGSRTSMGCLAAVIGTFILSLKPTFKKKIVIVAAGAIVCLLFIKVQAVDLANLRVGKDLFAGVLERLVSVQNYQTEVGYLSRVQVALDTIPKIQESPLFGHGPAKSGIINSNVDNEYILILYRHGIVGLLCTVGFVWVLARQYWNDLGGYQIPRKQIKHFANATLIASALFALTAGIFMSFRLMGLLILLWTVASRTVIPEPGLRVAMQSR